tara:strand:+ start:121 stop:417 length:297 start_codon:yes stop_codon:yes gene_type:complete
MSNRIAGAKRMPTLNGQELLELILGAAVLLVPALVLFERLIARKGIGVRSIQYIAVGTVVPVVALLSLRGMMQGEAVAAILAGLVGYLLGNISKFDDR